MPVELGFLISLDEETAEAAAAPSCAKSSIGLSVTDLIGDDAAASAGGRGGVPTFSPEFEFMLNGIVSGNKPGGGFSPIFINPSDGLRFVAVGDFCFCFCQQV